MPELPEVEITARLIGAATAGARIESALAPGINALRAYDPPLSALTARRIEGVRRRGKLFLVEFDDELTLLVHLMSAGDCSCSTRARRCATAPRGCWSGSTTAASSACASSAPSSAPGSSCCAAAEVEARGDARGRSGPRRGPTRRRSASCSTRRVRCTRCCATST